jgi:L-asparaginase
MAAPLVASPPGARPALGVSLVEGAAPVLPALPERIAAEGAGHVPAAVALILGEVAAAIPVVLASRAMAGPVFSCTYGYAGGEIDLLGRGLVAAGSLGGLKAGVLLGLALPNGQGLDAVHNAFGPHA